MNSPSYTPITQARSLVLETPQARSLTPENLTLEDLVQEVLSMNSRAMRVAPEFPPRHPPVIQTYFLTPTRLARLSKETRRPLLVETDEGSLPTSPPQYPL